MNTIGLPSDLPFFLGRPIAVNPDPFGRPFLFIFGGSLRFDTYIAPYIYTYTYT